MKIFYVDPKELAIDPENPRHSKAPPEKDATLLASIKAHGLQQALIVRPAGGEGEKRPPRGVKWYVMDGGRRFTQCVKAGLEEIPCRLNDSGYDAAELGTAINTSAAPMHPLDEAASIAVSLGIGGEDGTPQAIATRFGRTEAWVKQRLALDGLHATVKKLFRDGFVSLQGAQLFTLGSQKVQADYAKKAAKGPEWLLEASAIKRAMLDQKIPASMALFDLKDYPADKIETDLFAHGAGTGGDKANVYLLDRDKFEELQEAHIAETVGLLEEEGWEVLRPGVDEIHNLQSKYVKAEGRILKGERSKHVALVVYDPRAGTLDLRRGYIRRSQVGKAKVGKTAGGEDAVDTAEVATQTLKDVNENQLAMLGAMQADAIYKMVCAGADTLSQYMILAAIFGWHQHFSTQRPQPSWIGINTMFEDASKVGWSGELADAKVISFDEFKGLDEKEVGDLWCLAALRVIDLPRKPSDKTWLNGGFVPPQWYRPERGFLNRYRLDALQSYAKTVGVDFDGKKKKELVDILLKHEDHSAAYAKLFPKDKVKASLAETA